MCEFNVCSRCSVLVQSLERVEKQLFLPPGFFFEKDLDHENNLVECGIINYVQWHSF